MIVDVALKTVLTLLSATLVATVAFYLFSGGM